MHLIITSDNIDTKILKIHITSQFLNQFLDLLNSESSEKNYVKTILHQLYFKLIPKRLMIRKAINNFLLTVIHDTQSPNGVNELLEVYFYIISSFSIPLRNENILFFKEIIIPLHKVYHSNVFFENLFRCVNLFLIKDLTLAVDVLQFIIKYWPIGNSDKEILFLNEFKEVFKFCELNKLNSIINPIVKRLIKCMTGPHLQISNISASFLEDEQFLIILKKYKNEIFPFVASISLEFFNSHWNPLVMNHIRNFQKILKGIDESLFETCDKNEKKSLSFENSRKNIPGRGIIEAKWDALTAKAKVIDPFFYPPKIPY